MNQINTISISGSVPTVNQLALGDIAINTVDGKAFLKKYSGSIQSIVEIGAGGGGGTTVSASYALSASYASTASYATNFKVSGSIYDVDYIDFDTGSTVTQPYIGRLSWNNVDGTLDLGLKGGNVTLQVGQETVARVVNKTGGNLLESEFRVVRIRSVSEGGAQGQRLAVVLAQADNDADSATTLGVVTENINVNQEGFITIFGSVRGIDTTGANSWAGSETWVDGDMLYLSPFYPGYLTNVKPTAPNHLVIIGYVEYAHANNGKIFVKIDNGWELGELHNVLDNTTSGSYGDLLVRSGSVWTNLKALTGSYSITGSLTISGSSTFTNIGPAIFSGSVTGVQGFTGSFSGSATSALTASFVNPLSQSVLITGSLTLVGNELITGSSTWVVPGNAFGYISPGTDGISIGNSTSGVHIRVRNSNRTALDQSVGIGGPNFGWTTSQNLSIKTGGTTSTYQGILVGNGTNNTIFRVQGNSTVGVNVSDATAALHVQGTGTTSSTTSMLVQSSAGNQLFKIDDDGSVYLGRNGGSTWAATFLANTGVQGRIGNGAFQTPNAIYTYNSGTTMTFYNNNNSATGFDFQFNNNPQNNSTNQCMINLGGTYQTQNSFQFSSLQITPTYDFNVNTTALAVARGIYYNPTITNLRVAQHRAIETVTGDVLFGTTSGRVGIGTSSPSASLHVSGSVIATSFTGSLSGSATTSTTASFASTASFVNGLNQNVIITGSLAIATGSIGSGESALVVGPSPAGGAGEGGQIALLATGGTYTLTSFIDNYQDQFRILKGPGTTSNAGALSINLQTLGAKFEGAVTASAYSGLPNNYLYVTRNTTQNIGGGNWANQDVIFDTIVYSVGIAYNIVSGLATLEGGKVYRITARVAWSAAAAYTFEISCYDSGNVQLGPAAQQLGPGNGSFNSSNGAVDFIYAPSSNTDIKIRTTPTTNALSGEFIRGDLNTQLIIQQIA